MYRKYFKRPFDIFCSFCAITVLSPILLILTVVGAIEMKGNPFFTQERPGKDEKIFKLIKFRTLTCEKDENGDFLPDEKRLTKYGKFLRSTSLDELPELFNIFIGDMSVIGPRPLSIKYLPWYTEEERRRHSVRPGLSGLAQAKGRNSFTWEEKFAYDIEYIENITFWGDIKIIFLTVYSVLKRENIGQGEQAPISLHIQRQQLAANAEKSIEKENVK